MLRPDARIIQTRRNRMTVENLAVVGLQQVGTVAMQDTRLAAGQRRTMLVRIDALATGFNANDLENLSKYQIYLKLAVDGLTARPFSARTLPPEIMMKNENNGKNIIKSSREKYGMRREIIEDKIQRWCDKAYPLD